MTHASIPIIARAVSHPHATAIIDESGSYTYEKLLAASARAASVLLAGEHDLREARVALLVPSGFDYVVVQWAIWRAGGMAVPLSQLHPPVEWEYTLTDSGAAIVVAHETYREALAPLAQKHSLRFLTIEQLSREPAAATALPHVEEPRRALMLYTSGTTSKPKGVVTTHATISAQIRSLVEAWEWAPTDRVLHVLPLHHIHGVINVLCCALWSGACCEMLAKFDAEASWDAIASGRLTLFMGVPTIYTRLIQSWERAGPERKKTLTAGCAKIRVMVCGSAALPVSTLEQWRTVSGHTLLERYGMTEIGMGFSNPLHGKRNPGCVGEPLPHVEARLVDEQGNGVPDGTPGEIQIKGPTVFSEYWNKPDATRTAFVDGWFKTGDVATRENGVYRILGRSSIDIIKTGGYKVSALEIEDVLREHPAVLECAVVGVPDAEWGERVAAAVVLKPGASLAIDELRAWAKARLAVYKLPSLLRHMQALPRNAMGKVTKPALAPIFVDLLLSHPNQRQWKGLCMSESPVLVVIAAHCDDAELNAGGTMAKWAARGEKVHIVSATNSCAGFMVPPGDDGSREYRVVGGEMTPIRYAEQDAAAALIGATVHYLNYTQRHYWDGQRQVRLNFDAKGPPPDAIKGLVPLLMAFQLEEHITKMSRLLVGLAPTLVLCQPPTDLDPEHHALASLTWSAFQKAGDQLAGVPLRFYTPGSSCQSGLFEVPYDTFEDITDTFDMKLKLCAAHASQMTAFRWRMVKDRAAHFGAKFGVKYAEPFVTAKLGRHVG